MKDTAVNVCRVNDLLEQKNLKTRAFHARVCRQNCPSSSALSSNSTNECYGKIVTYTPTSKEIKRKRGWGYGSRGRRSGKKWRSGKETRRARGEFHLREYTRCYTSVKLRSSWRRDLFWGGLHGAPDRARPKESVFYFLRETRDVWRQFHCAFHSVGRFEIQVRIPFVLKQRRG